MRTPCEQSVDKQTVLLAACYLFTKEADVRIFGAIEQEDPARAAAWAAEGSRLQHEADRIYSAVGGTTEQWRRAVAWVESGR